MDVFADAFLYAVADNEKGSGGQSGGNRQKREKKLRSQPDFPQAGCPPLRKDLGTG
jgi:hypothetical protein